MKKAIISRALMGFPAGIAIGQCISLLVSAFLGKGTFQSCVPSFVAAMGSELGAVALQTLLCGILGAASAASSVVWATDWSLVKRTVVSFLVLTLSILRRVHLDLRPHLARSIPGLKAQDQKAQPEDAEHVRRLQKIILRRIAPGWSRPDRPGVFPSPSRLPCPPGEAAQGGC